jgi:hypothetical protein
VNDEIVKDVEAMVAYPEVLSRHFQGHTEENREET